MSQTPVTTPVHSSQRLVDQVSRLRASLAPEHVRLTDMSRAGVLESGIGASGIPESTEPPRAPVSIARLEGPIAPREVAVAPPGATRFRFFLDGTQQTIPTVRIGLVPVVAALSAAGILSRDPTGHPSLRSAAMRVNQSWIAPLNTGNRALEHLLDELRDAGADIRDPLVDRFGSPLEGYDLVAGDYARLLSHSFDLAGRIRDEQEAMLVNLWETELSREHPGDWIVIDGRLPGNVPNAIGLVKTLQTQHLTNREAMALFDLPQGHRTTAFRFATNPDDADPSSTQGKTMWFMRLWSAHGMDARHSLVRIEAAHDVCTTDQIDEISGWILAERLPRATEDPRWPTLLYPVYYLERILKRRLAAITAGWPSA